jgi:serine-type D-Ala-D-Ala carboxypeptidase/endopeptidase (penicillin-binding protein 4)
MFPGKPESGKGRESHSPAGPDPHFRTPRHNGAVRRPALAAAVLALVLASAARAAGDLPLPTRLASALAVHGAPAAQSGAVAVDLTTGRTVFARNADLPLAPASNEKLVVTYAAFVELGPQYRFRTQVLGRGSLDGDTWRGNIVLKGFGDPSLTSLRLLRLATLLARQGVHHVDGRVLGDDSWFDAQRTAPGWKPSYYLDECAPISALVVDGGVYQHHVALTPALAAAARFRQLLRTRGITAGPVGVGRADDSATVLAETDSAPLADVVQEIDVQSDNLGAEMLLKTVGAEAGTGGTTAAGLVVARRDLTAAGVPLQGVRLVDGSGLSLEDRLTAHTLTALLLAAWQTTELRVPFLKSLPVAGISGTLKHRMQHRPARGAVHAKTGTTDEATALAGYVRDRYAFAVVDNGHPVWWSATRRAQDRFATALAATP